MLVTLGTGVCQSLLWRKQLAEVPLRFGLLAHQIQND
jgi:hypothetical protein